MNPVMLLLKRLNPGAPWRNRASGGSAWGIHLPTDALSRYVSRAFLKNLFLVVAFLITLVVISTFLGEVDKVFNGWAGVRGFLEKTLQTLPDTLDLMLPMGILLAALFTFTGFGRTSELVAMKSAGFSPLRMMIPLMVLMVPIAAFSYVNKSYFRPWLNPENASLTEASAERQKWRIHGNRLYYFSRMDMPNGSLGGIQMYQTDPLTGKISVLAAIQRGVRDGEGWRFQRISQQRAEGTLWVMESQDNQWVPPEAFPQVFRPMDLDLAHTPFLDLYGEIQRLAQEGRNVTNALLAWYGIPAALYAMFLMVWIAVCLSQGHVRFARGSGELLIAIVIGLCFWVSNEVFQMLGRGGTLTPFLGAWMANFLFTGLGGWLFLRAR
ncbi:MAG: LptF/LptG family permease [Deltaproteobacteria bacterium]|nr:LptF/LptG family permease [Deltaproteobacteria bacterium]